MPLYEYQCTSCAAVTDIRHGFNEATSEACPACGGNLKRQFNPAGIVFKGSGFYVTDSRKAAPSATKSDAAKSDTVKSDAAKSETSPSGAAKSDTGKSAETKPAAPSGPKSDAAA